MPDDSRKTVDAQGLGVMLLLCMIWGFQQVVIKASAGDVSPLLQIALRSGVAALLVLLMMRWQGEALSTSGGTLKPGLLAGVLFAVEFLFVGAAVNYTSASHLVVFLYTAPIFAALGLAWRLPSERLRPLQWLGIALAFAGVATTFLHRGGATATADHPNMLLGDGLALLAGVFWGATTVVVRCSSLARASAKLTLLYQLGAAFVLLLLAAVVMGHTVFKSTTLAWGSLAFQSVIGAFASFLAWFWLLRKYLASRLGVFTFTTPLFGMAFGVWLLDEKLEPGFLLGAAMVLAGVLVVSGYDWVRAAWAAWLGDKRPASP